MGQSTSSWFSWHSSRDELFSHRWQDIAETEKNNNFETIRRRNLREITKGKFISYDKGGGGMKILRGGSEIFWTPEGGALKKLLR